MRDPVTDSYDCKWPTHLQSESHLIPSISPRHLSPQAVPPASKPATESQLATYGSSLDIIQSACNLIMQNLNPHLCPNAQGWQYCDIKVLVGHVVWSLLYSLQKMGDLKDIPRAQRKGEKDRELGRDQMHVFFLWRTRLTWGLQLGLDLIWSCGTFSSRHIIGQGNKGPPAWQNWIRNGLRCESAMVMSTANTAAALQISLSPFRWGHLQSFGNGADGNWARVGDPKRYEVWWRGGG